MQRHHLILLLFSFFFIQTSQALAAPQVRFQTECQDGQERIGLSFVGDILVHEALYRAVVNGTQHFNQIWRRTDPLMTKAHFSVGNLEGPAALGVDKRGKDHGDVGFIYDEVVYSGSNFSFNYHPRILSDLYRSGYDLLTVANNHSLDRSWLGIDKTIRAARNVGIPTVGIRMSSERSGAFHHIASIGGFRVAFLGCTEMSNGHKDSKDQVLFCYKNPDKMVELIKNITSDSSVDALILLPHWGQEYKHSPDSRQKAFARRYLEAGVTAILGSHPHVLQPWEKYVTKDGRETLVAYSLGNFVAGQAGLARKTGLVVYLGLARTAGRVKIFGASYTPTYREGTEIYPVTKNQEVFDHVASMYGKERRLDAAGDLMSHLCLKNE
ncbi:Capsule biosynthesis protein CapA [Bdellovibrio bacteriovorus]|uniref:CapA family protein n=1 Tax=Bdellovibrio bacteriovorus TaxID=959 RepID=UPI00045C16DF|nr:CapA family protein [Bdellovibrio bacteriovorus]AHZ85334.1 capsular biosynthesis protein [Bdellovibrio bacteriovorus]BEV69228.1 Capsule biosynthesis protein CapA [Bdellovibrio bacteriovorus]